MPRQDYGLITDHDELSEFVSMLRHADKPVGFDVETGYDGEPKDRASTNQKTAKIVGFSFTNSRHWARYVPVRHDEGPNLPWGLTLFEPVLRECDVVAHNFAFERRMLNKEGIQPRIFSDTMIEAYCLGEFEEHGLKPLVRHIFGHEMADIMTLWPGIKAKDKKRIRFNDRDQTDPAVISYACEDAAWCLALHEELGPRVRERRSDIFSVEMKCLPVVSEMEEAGVEIDFEYLRSKGYDAHLVAEEYRQHVNELLAKEADTTVEGLAEIADAPWKGKKGEKHREFNVNSAPQLRKVLFDHCGYQVKWTTAGGEQSTSTPALTKLAAQSSAVEALLEYRKLTKLIGSYLDKWPDDFSQGEEQARVHPSWKQNGVPAGRFAVGDPGIQQCPKDFSFRVNDKVLEGNFRDCITCAPEYYLLDFDYSQIELRAIAGMAQEPKLLEGFARGDDPHELTAELIGGDRTQGKTFNFALIYQMGKKSMAERLGVPQRRANLLYTRFFEGYTALNDWIEEQKYKGTSREYVETYFGRKVPIFEFEYARRKEAEGQFGKARGLYGHGERLCVNAPVQGTAADIAKIAMVKSMEAIDRERLDARLVINNHDELVYEVHKSISPNDMIDLLKPEVEIEVPGFPPLETEWEIGERWGKIQGVKGESEDVADAEG